MNLLKVLRKQEGLDVAGDQYPYYWSSTPISGCMFPRWSLEGGREKTLLRMKDSDIREKIKNETTNFINRFHGAQGCVLADYPEDTNLEGLNLIEISKIKNTTPEESVMQLYEKSEGSFILHSMEEKDVNEIAKYKYMCVASDGNSLKLMVHFHQESLIHGAMEQIQDLLNNLFRTIKL